MAITASSNVYVISALMLFSAAQWYGSESCTSRVLLDTCMEQYMMDISIRMLEGIAILCRDKYILQQSLERCIAEKVVDCDSRLKLALEKQAESARETLFDVIDTMFCDPTEGCNILDIYEDCYTDLFERLHIHIPDNSRDAPDFVDKLRQRLYFNQTAFCRATSAPDLEERVECAIDAYRDLFTGCGFNQGKVIETQSRAIFHSSIGELGVVSMAKAARHAMCSGQCSNFQSRFEDVMLCITSSSGEGLFDSESEEYICNYIATLKMCVDHVIRDCSPLGHVINSNVRFRQEMERCGVMISCSDILRGTVLPWLFTMGFLLIMVRML